MPRMFVETCRIDVGQLHECVRLARAVCAFRTSQMEKGYDVEKVGASAARERDQTAKWASLKRAKICGDCATGTGPGWSACCNEQWGQCRRQRKRADASLTESAVYIEEFNCAGCARTGHATWDGEAGTKRRLIEISDGFDICPDADDQHNLVIVCAHCSAVQPKQVSPALTPH